MTYYTTSSIKPSECYVVNCPDTVSVYLVTLPYVEVLLAQVTQSYLPFCYIKSFIYFLPKRIIHYSNRRNSMHEQHKLYLTEKILDFVERGGGLAEKTNAMSFVNILGPSLFRSQEGVSKHGDMGGWRRKESFQSF
jgi:hypothetical protein